MNYLESYNASEGFFGSRTGVVRTTCCWMLDYASSSSSYPEEDLHRGPAAHQTAARGGGRPAVRHRDQHQCRPVALACPATWCASPAPHPRIQVSGRTKSFINAFGEEAS